MDLNNLKEKQHQTIQNEFEKEQLLKLIKEKSKEYIDLCNDYNDKNCDRLNSNIRKDIGNFISFTGVMSEEKNINKIFIPGIGIEFSINEGVLDISTNQKSMTFAIELLNTNDEGGWIDRCIKVNNVLESVGMGSRFMSNLESMSFQYIKEAYNELENSINNVKTSISICTAKGKDFEYEYQYSEYDNDENIHKNIIEIFEQDF